MDVCKSCLYNENLELQGVAVEGFAKLHLLKVYRDIEVLGGLLLLYYHPSTTANERVRQCLNYFLQVFAYSSDENQSYFAQVRRLIVTTKRLISVLAIRFFPQRLDAAAQGMRKRHDGAAHRDCPAVD